MLVQGRHAAGLAGAAPSRQPPTGSRFASGLWPSATSLATRDRQHTAARAPGLLLHLYRSIDGHTHASGVPVYSACAGGCLHRADAPLSVLRMRKARTADIRSGRNRACYTSVSDSLQVTAARWFEAESVRHSPGQHPVGSRLHAVTPGRSADSSHGADLTRPRRHTILAEAQWHA